MSGESEAARLGGLLSGITRRVNRSGSVGAVLVCSPALVKGVYLDSVVCVLLQDFLCVFICVEGVHEDQGDVCVVRPVQVLWDIKKNIKTKTRW